METLAEVAAAAKPDTLLRWYRELIAKKFDGSRFRKSVGRPSVAEEIERLVAQMARENPSWGYDRITGAMMNLGHTVSSVYSCVLRSGAKTQPNPFLSLVTVKTSE
jgi:hypothetical protein